MKTCENVTKFELAEFLEAVTDLLGAARMMFWEGGHEVSEDSSFRDAIARMESAFKLIGFDQGTNEEFVARLTHILNGGVIAPVRKDQNENQPVQ